MALAAAAPAAAIVCPPAHRSALRPLLAPPPLSSALRRSWPLPAVVAAAAAAAAVAVPVPGGGSSSGSSSSSRRRRRGVVAAAEVGGGSSGSSGEGGGDKERDGGDDTPPADDPSKSSKQQEQRQKSTLLSRLLGALARFVAGCLLLLALLPYLISTRAGTRAVARVASEALQAHVAVDELRLHWSAPLLVRGVAVHEARDPASRRLVALGRLSSTAPLLHVLGPAGRRDWTLTLAGAEVDCSFGPDGLPRLATLVRSAARRLRAAGGMGGSSGGSRAELAAEAAALVSHAVLASPAELAAAEAEAAADDAPAPAPGSGKTQKPVPLPPPPPLPPAAAAAGSLPAELLALRERLAVADAEARVSLELRLPPTVAVFVPDAKLLLPAELKAALGAHVHAVAAVGAAPVRALADELGEDAGWLERTRRPAATAAAATAAGQQQEGKQEAAAAAAAAAAAGASGKVGAPPAGRGPAAAAAAAEAATAAAAVVDGFEGGFEPWPLPPEGVGRRAWRRALPLLLQVSGDQLSASARGWRVGARRYALERPARAAWRLTPELARLTLSLANPLLEDVAGVAEDAELQTAVAPAGGLVPAPSATVLVSPVRLLVAQGHMLQQVTRLLGVAVRGSGSGSSGHAHHQTHKGGDSKGGSSKGDVVELWSGPLRVEVLTGAAAADGGGGDGSSGGGGGMVIRTRRVDVLVGEPSAGLHLALWGDVDLRRAALDFTLGLPASALARAGIRGLPAGYVLPLAVRGALTRPAIEWQPAARKLAVLSATSLGEAAAARGLGGAALAAVDAAVDGPSATAAAAAAAASSGGGGGGGGFGRSLGLVNRALSGAAAAFLGAVDRRVSAAVLDVPPPEEALPWELQRQKAGGGAAAQRQ